MRWDDLHDGILADMVQAGKSLKEIAAVMGCTPMAVSVRKRKIGIRHSLSEYRVTDPEGKSVTASTISGFVAENWTLLGMEGDPPATDVRRTIPAMGLEWALSSGWKWKGWSVSLIRGSTKPGRRKKKA